MHRASERPEDALGAQVFALFRGHALRGARLWPPQKCRSPAPVKIAQRMSRSSHRSIQAAEISSEVALSRMLALAGLFSVM